MTTDDALRSIGQLLPSIPDRDMETLEALISLVEQSAFDRGFEARRGLEEKNPKEKEEVDWEALIIVIIKGN